MRVLIVVLVVLGLGLLYRTMKPASPLVSADASPVAVARPAPVEPVPVAALSATPAPAVNEARTLEWRIAQGHLQQLPASLVVQQGETLRLRVTSDRADQLHLHGYDRALALKPGVPAQLELTADHSGRFDLELHHSGLELGALEVQPR